MNDDQLQYCNLLGLPAIPTFGVYDLNEYDLMHPVQGYREATSIDELINCSFFPDSMRKSLHNLKSLNFTDINYYAIEYDSKEILLHRFESDRFKRIKTLNKQ